MEFHEAETRVSWMASPESLRLWCQLETSLGEACLWEEWLEVWRPSMPRQGEVDFWNRTREGWTCRVRRCKILDQVCFFFAGISSHNISPLFSFGNLKENDFWILGPSSLKMKFPGVARPFLRAAFHQSSVWPCRVVACATSLGTARVTAWGREFRYLWILRELESSMSWIEGDVHEFYWKLSIVFRIFQISTPVGMSE